MLATLRETNECDDDHEWGYQIRMVNEGEYSGKLLVLENSKPGSLHYHKLKKETFIVLYGTVLLSNSDGPGRFLNVGDKMTFEPRQWHRMSAVDGMAVILEVATHDDDSDTYREMTS